MRHSILSFEKEKFYNFSASSLRCDDDEGWRLREQVLVKGIIAATSAAGRVASRKPPGRHQDQRHLPGPCACLSGAAVLSQE